MFLTKLKITNFKAFKDSVELDLTLNANGITKDLQNGRIIKVDKKYFLPVVAIGGANGRGKTSLLDSISFFTKMLLPNKFDEFYLVNIKDNLKDLSIDIKNQIEKICDILKNETDYFKNDLNVYIFNNLALSELIHERLKNINQDISETALTELLDFVCEALNSSLDKSWFNEKHNKNQRTEIVLSLYDQQYGEFSVSLNDDKYFNDEKEQKIFKNIISWSVNFTKKTKKIDSQFIKDLNDFINTINGNEINTLIGELRPFLTMNLLFVDSLIKVIKLIGEKTVNKILNMIDSNFDKLIFKEETSAIDEILLKDNTKVNINKLSDGTKRFIQILYITLSSLNKTNGNILVIDELDAYLHTKLTDFFKLLIFAINNQNSNNNIQLIFSSHNPIVLTNLLSNKQIFLLNDDENSIYIEKASHNIRGTRSTLKNILANKIGSSPSNVEITDLIYELSNNLLQKNENQ